MSNTGKALTNTGELTSGKLLFTMAGLFQTPAFHNFPPSPNLGKIHKLYGLM